MALEINPRHAEASESLLALQTNRERLNETVRKEEEEDSAEAAEFAEVGEGECAVYLEQEAIWDFGSMWAPLHWEGVPLETEGEDAEADEWQQRGETLNSRT